MENKKKKNINSLKNDLIFFYKNKKKNKWWKE